MCESLVGLRPITSEIDKKKLLFFEKLCNFSHDILVKKIFLFRLFTYLNDKQDKSFGYVKDIFSILHKYSLEQYLTSYLETGIFPSKTEWKKMIKSEIFRYESHQWTNRTIHDSDFTRFIILHNGTGLPRIWKFAWSAQQSNIIKVITKLWTITPTRNISTCQLCNTQYTDIFKHVACSCAYFSTNRDIFWSDIINFDRSQSITHSHLNGLIYIEQAHWAQMLLIV